MTFKNDYKPNFFDKLIFEAVRQVNDINETLNSFVMPDIPTFEILKELDERMLLIDGTVLKGFKLFDDFFHAIQSNTNDTVTDMNKVSSYAILRSNFVATSCRIQKWRSFVTEHNDGKKFQQINHGLIKELTDVKRDLTNFEIKLLKKLDRYEEWVQKHPFVKPKPVQQQQDRSATMFLLPNETKVSKKTRTENAHVPPTLPQLQFDQTEIDSQDEGIGGESLVPASSVRSANSAVQIDSHELVATTCASAEPTISATPADDNVSTVPEQWEQL